MASWATSDPDMRHASPDDAWPWCRARLKGTIDGKLDEAPQGFEFLETAEQTLGGLAFQVSAPLRLKGINHGQSLGRQVILRLVQPGHHLRGRGFASLPGLGGQQAVKGQQGALRLVPRE